MCRPRRAMLGATPLSPALPAASADEQVLRVGAQATDVSTLEPHRTSTTPEKGPISWIFGGLEAWGRGGGHGGP